MIDHSFNLDDLLHGKTDAMSLYSTAYAAALKSRGIALIQKPYQRDDLLREVREALDRERPQVS